MPLTLFVTSCTLSIPLCEASFGLTGTPSLFEKVGHSVQETEIHSIPADDMVEWMQYLH